MRGSLRIVPFALIICAGVAVAATVERSQIGGGAFTVLHWPGDEKLARDTLELLQQTAEDLAPRLNAGADPIRVTICRSLNEFKQIAGRFGRTWVAGVAHSEKGEIAVKAPHMLPQRSDYAGIVRHELVHVLLARNTNEAYVPRWFNEGLAMMASGELRWGAPARVARMYSTGRLIRYPDLDLAFIGPDDERHSSDAYAQALSMTRYLKGLSGEQKFWDLVHAMRDTPFEKALAETTGMTAGDFYSSWRGSLWKTALLAAAASAFTSFNLALVLAALAWLRRRRRNRLIMQQWLDEELEYMVDRRPAWQPYVVSPPEWTEDEEDDERS